MSTPGVPGPSATPPIRRFGTSLTTVACSNSNPRTDFIQKTTARLYDLASTLGAHKFAIPFTFDNEPWAISWDEREKVLRMEPTRTLYNAVMFPVVAISPRPGSPARFDFKVNSLPKTTEDLSGLAWQLIEAATQACQAQKTELDNRNHVGAMNKLRAFSEGVFGPKSSTASAAGATGSSTVSRQLKFAQALEEAGLKVLEAWSPDNRGSLAFEHGRVPMTLERAGLDGLALRTDDARIVLRKNPITKTLEVEHWTRKPGDTLESADTLKVTQLRLDSAAAQVWIGPLETAASLLEEAKKPQGARAARPGQ